MMSRQIPCFRFLIAVLILAIRDRKRDIVVLDFKMSCKPKLGWYRGGNMFLSGGFMFYVKYE